MHESPLNEIQIVERLHPGGETERASNNGWRLRVCDWMLAQWALRSAMLTMDRLILSSCTHQEKVMDDRTAKIVADAHGVFRELIRF